MPGGDRTGPMGQGPMSGRGRGYCAGYAVPGYMNPEPGMGYGMGFGRGWGRGRGFGRGRGRGMGWGRYNVPAPVATNPTYSQPAPEQELAFLRSQADMLAGELEAVRKRMEELETQDKEGD